MPKRKRKETVKDVRCTVRVIVGGKTVKTIKRNLSLAVAVKEIGGDLIATEGRLLTGVPLNKRRTIVRGVSIVLQYVWKWKEDAQICKGTSYELNDVREVIRAGMPL